MKSIFNLRYTASAMLNSFIIVMREGFESFLLVAVILAYLRKSGQKWLTSSVFVAIALALAASAGLAYVLNTGVDDATVQSMFGPFIGGYVSQFFANEALREAILGAIAVVMVGTLVIHMWRTGPKIQQRMRERLSAVSSKSSRIAAVAGVFLFTFLMITREGMETALMLMQVKDQNLITGALLGLLAAITFAFGWARFGHLINLKRFFQVTGIFLLLFMVQVSIYSFHEFSEAGLLPNSDFLHEATEKFSPDGLYGKWFSPIMIGICALWLLGAWLIDRRATQTTSSPVLASTTSLSDLSEYPQRSAPSSGI
ncbi:MAG TPA: FTR1 family protein [Pyrinomonadaceae bacterium]|nr:FTR1 family protein [Pyrinomonadaceae bacterium]